MINIKKRAPFITFEGGEGSGKTTQLRELGKFLQLHHVPFIMTREPGGTPEGEALREFFLYQKDYNWDEKNELLVIMTCRWEHIKSKILPAIEKGVWVLCDRFIDSSIVYQGYRYGVSSEWIFKIHQLLGIYLVPDLTFILNPPVEESMKRCLNNYRENNRLDNQDITFHKKIYEGYNRIAKENVDRCFLLPSAGNIEAIAEEIQFIIKRRYDLKQNYKIDNLKKYNNK